MDERFPLVRMAVADGQVFPKAWLIPRSHAVVVTGQAGLAAGREVSPAGLPARPG